MSRSSAIGNAIRRNWIGWAFDAAELLMLQKYRTVFRLPGSAAFCAASFVMRMPLAMYALGIVLVISAREGKYGFAGVLSACYVFGNAVGAQVLSVLVDRFGQRRLILPAGVVHAGSGVLFAIMLKTGVPDWLLVPPALAFGFSYLAVGSLVRARWSNLLDGKPELSTALSVESVLDEVIFVVGPLIATVLATQLDPVLVIYLGVGCVSVGSLWLASLRDTEPAAHPGDETGHVSALRAHGMVVLTLASVGMGALFASAEVSMVAYCGQHGHRPWSGLVLAAMAAGSGVSGFVYGAIGWRADVLNRFRMQSVVFAVLPCVLFAATGVASLALCAFGLGLGIAPALITMFGLVQQIVAVRSLTEGLSWIGTGLNVGYGTGAAVVGGIADHHGARAAFVVVVACSASVGVFGVLLRAERSAAPSAQRRTAVAP
jgi:MFS family permease